VHSVFKGNFENRIHGVSNLNKRKSSFSLSEFIYNGICSLHWVNNISVVSLFKSINFSNWIMFSF